MVHEKESLIKEKALLKKNIEFQFRKQHSNDEALVKANERADAYQRERDQIASECNARIVQLQLREEKLVEDNGVMYDNLLKEQLDHVNL